MGTPLEKKRSYIWEPLLTGGYLLFFCMACTAGVTLYSFSTFPSKDEPVNVIATNLPPQSPVPHIHQADISDADIILEERFHDDGNEWRVQDPDEAILEVRDGALNVQSKYEGTYSIAECWACPYITEPYFLEVDIETTQATNAGFGIVFNVGRIRNVFYLFLVNPEAKEYHIFHHNISGWSRRVSGNSAVIKPFPRVNTLGIYANGSLVELYINGEMVDTYSYSEDGVSLHTGYIGLYTNDAGFIMVADNLIIRKVGE